MEQLSHNTENQYDQVNNEKTKNELAWEQNHTTITKYIMQHLSEHSIMPNKSEIAKGTGLSRETVYQHMRNNAERPVRNSNLADGFEMVADQVKVQILKKALSGDLSAAKLFLEVSGNSLKPKEGDRNFNFLQINKTVFKQEMLKDLEPDQLRAIELAIHAEIMKRAGELMMRWDDPLEG